MDDSAFDEPDSYQSKALSFIESVPGIESKSDAKVVQYFAMYCIFYATDSATNPYIESLQALPPDDPNYFPPNIRGWFDKSVAGWEDPNVDPCNFLTITCVNDRVTSIVLKDNFLTGEFPAEIILLASDNDSGAGRLREIDVADNLYLFSADISWISDLGPEFREFF